MTKKEYRCRVNLNIYDSPSCDTLATQAAAGRHLRIVLSQEDNPDNLLTTGTADPVKIQLCEDNYPGWLASSDLKHLDSILHLYQAPVLSSTEIQNRIPTVITFAHAAMGTPNHYYLWGGTLAPNYDCSGLMQAAFASAGIWLPRDAYQQEAFTQPVVLEDIQPGDLVFFGPPEKATHVGLYLGEGRYIHSSGQKYGRNGIGIDRLSEEGDKVTQFYYQQLRGAGRVVASYQPQSDLAHS